MALLSTESFDSFNTKAMIGYAIYNRVIKFRKDLIQSLSNHEHYIVIKNPSTGAFDETKAGEDDNKAQEQFKELTSAPGSIGFLIYVTEGKAMVLDMTKSAEKKGPKRLYNPAYAAIAEYVKGSKPGLFTAPITDQDKAGIKFKELGGEK